MYIPLTPAQQEWIKKERQRQYEAEAAHARGDRTPEGYLKHIVCEGARWHVTSWGLGPHGAFTRCSEPDCEINHRQRQLDEENQKDDPHGYKYAMRKKIIPLFDEFVF